MRSFWLFTIFFSFLLTSSSYAADNCIRLHCYHYDPNDPYVDPEDDELFKFVVAPKKICGTKAGRFFIAAAEHSYKESQALCEKEIPRGHKILRMRAHQSTKREYPISFGEQARTNSVFKRIVVFGDSLSEEGKAVSLLKRLHHPVIGAVLACFADIADCPIPERFMELGLKPYWNGMFSNGPVWPIYLSMFLDNIAVDNYSFGGATTGKRKCRVRHLQQMVDKHLERNKHNKKLEDNLYVILMGGNNYFLADGRVKPRLTEQERDQTVAKAMSDIEEAVNRLFSKGARHILLFTMANPKASPKWEFSHSSDSLDVEKEEWHKSIELHNKELKRLAPRMGEKWGLSVYLFDSEANWNEYAERLAVDTNTTWRHSTLSREEILQKPGFFDPIHPTTRIHCEIARQLLDYLYSSKLVEPTQYLPDCTETVNQFR